MRSLTTEKRSPVAVSMPGRYKSCRRSPSELLTKEQEQELQQCVQNDNDMKAEQDEAKEKESQSPVKTSDGNPPKLTPLRWRSTSMKELNGSQEVAPSALPAEDSIKISPVSSAQSAEEVRHSQPAKRPSQAQLRAQVMYSLSKEEVDTTVQEGEGVNHAQAGEPVIVPVDREHAPGKEGSTNSPKPVECVNTVTRTELFPAKHAQNVEEKSVISARLEEPAKAEEAGKAPERKEFSPGIGMNGVAVGKKPDKPRVVPLQVDLPEEVVFQPVDLDQKYREKELVRHVTAAKIQNREEALLNNPGSPAVNGRKGPVGEESAAMTIEFLRARLQAERSASKTVKLKMDQMSKKVVELESRLVAEVELRKSAEASLNDALAKLKVAVAQGNPVPICAPQKVADAELKDSMKTVQRIDLGSKTEVIESKTVSLGEVPLANDIPVEGKKEPVGTDVAKEDAAAAVKGDEERKGGLWRDRSVSALPSDSLQGVGKIGGGIETVTRASQESSSGSSPERSMSPTKLKQEKSRAVIEERLRSMWAKIGEDMAALSEVREDENSASKDSTGWMGQLPSVLQEKQQSSGDSGPANGQHLDSSEGDSEHPESVHTDRKTKQDSLSHKAAALVEKRTSFKRNSSLAKNVAKLVEQYEFQETAQREWEENFEAQQSLEQNEGEPPALVTRDGDVVSESRVKRSSARSQSRGERSQNANGESISRSKSLGFLPSQQGMTKRSISRKGSSSGRIETIDDSPIEENGGDPEELVFDPETEVAEELPNGIYLHHSREEVDSYKRGSKDAVYRRGGTERVAASNDIHSPRRQDRGAHHSRERFPRTDPHGEADQQGWPVREVQDRASRDMYYEPVINNRMRGDTPPYSSSDREFYLRPKPIPERSPDDMYRNGPWREGPGMDRIPRPEDRRVPATHFSNQGSEEAQGMPYGYRRDHAEQNLPYTAASYRQREDSHSGVPAWQEGGDPSLRSRGMTHRPYGYPPTHGVEEPQQPSYPQPGQYGDNGGYSNRREVHYMSHGAQNAKPDYYPSIGVSGPRPPMNAYEQPDRPPASQGYAGWESGGHEDRSAPVVGSSDDGRPAGEAGEVLKALRIAKQQIKSSTGEQAAYMTAQYTVSQEHRYGAGGQVSKTSYTVEAPVGYPCLTKTVHEGWHLEGGKSSAKRRNGLNGSNAVSMDLTGANVTEFISGAGPLTLTGGESSYVEKLNVGRGIQFFFG